VTRKKKPVPSGTQMHVSVVLDSDLVKSLDDEAERLSKERQGLAVRRTDVVRMALYEWVTARAKQRAK
jgi:predicted transcriptional regulator